MATDPAQLEVFGPEFEADPHHGYAALREACPVRKVTLSGGQPGWLITRYDDVRAALADPRLGKESAPSTGETGQLPPTWTVVSRRTLGQHMLNVDPPRHTRLRRLVSAAFTTRSVDALVPRIHRITDELLAAIAGEEQVDLVDRFTFPLPIRVICELLGVPPADQDSFRAWTNTIVARGVPRAELPAAIEGLGAYLRQLAASKRAAPADDMLSALIAVRDQGDRLSEDELTSMAFLLLLAGHETTATLLSNAVYALLRHPDQLARLRAHPELLPLAIEEFLRYESPLETSTYRHATEPVEIGGQLIGAGDLVLLALLSANRDEGRFPDSDGLDVARAPNPHLAFGHGIHHCLGAPLARLEARIALGALLARFRTIRLAVPADELDWKEGNLIRGLTTLPVTLR